MLGEGFLSSYDGSPKGNVPKNFELLPYAALRVRLHPVPLMTILDAFIRRDEGQENVIGTLLGSCTDGNVVEVTDCFVDRHSLTGEGLLQIIKDHHESMFELKQQASGSGSGARESVVGWFCTGSEMTELTCAVHGWFKQFPSVSKFFAQPPLTEPIHLMVDAAMESGSFSVKAFTQVAMSMARDACVQFQELPLEIFTSPSDRTALSLLLKARRYRRRENPNGDLSLATEGTAVPLSQLQTGFPAAVTMLKDRLEFCAAYVRAVLRGEVNPDPEIGRFLAGALCANPGADQESMEQVMQNLLQDNLMLTHLTSLAKLQFSIAEKLNTSFF